VAILADENLHHSTEVFSKREHLQNPLLKSSEFGGAIMQTSPIGKF
jgi:hypothetical protein